MTTETKNQKWMLIVEPTHDNCVVCSKNNTKGLNLDFYVSETGQVRADFTLSEHYQGYHGIIHGGIISAILDGAMTNCLFAMKRIAVTADFRIRYRHPVQTDKPAKVRASIIRATPPLFVLEAEITQDGIIKTLATAKFMEQKQLKPAIK